MSSAIRLISKVICLVLILSFGMFITDELTTASGNQTALAGSHAQKVVVRDAHGREINPDKTKIRAKLDQVNDALTSPAEKLVTGTSGTTSPWVERAVPFILGMLFFGLGLHMLANWLEMSRSGDTPVSDPQAGFTSGYR
jgi:hypothetical protein